MGDLPIMKIVTDVANELTIGEMRQLGAVDACSSPKTSTISSSAPRRRRSSPARARAARCAARPSYAQPLAQYGDRLGMAFQIADDMLDYTGDESVTGKPGGLDLREHKITLPLIAALPRFRRRPRACRCAVRAPKHR